MKIGNITLPPEVLQMLDPATLQQLQDPRMAQALEQAVGNMKPMYTDFIGQVKSGQMSMDDLHYFNPMNHVTPEDYARFGLPVPEGMAQQQAQPQMQQPQQQMPGNYMNPQTGSPEFAWRRGEMFDKAKAAAQAVAKLFGAQPRQVQQAPAAPVQQVVQNQLANAPVANPAIPVAPMQTMQAAYQPKAMTQQISSAMAGQMMPNRAVLNMPTKTVETFQSSANPINLMAGGVGSKMFLKNVAQGGAATPATNIMRGLPPQGKPPGTFGTSQQEDTNPDARDTAEKMISSGMFKY